MASNNYKLFGCFTRKFKLPDARPPADVIEAFARYADDGSSMTASQLRRFLVEVQGMEEAEAESKSQRIYQHMNQKRKHLNRFSKQQGLSLDDFFAYLFDGDLNGPITTQVMHLLSCFFRILCTITDFGEPIWWIWTFCCGDRSYEFSADRETFSILILHFPFTIRLKTLNQLGEKWQYELN